MKMAILLSRFGLRYGVCQVGSYYLFCLAACQPATVQLENKVRLTKSYMKVAQINNEQN